MYRPGLHIISEFKTLDSETLKNSNIFRKFIDSAINKNNLQKVGEVYHEFPNSGYTAVVCLTESHISIHTWPEYNKVTFDVFLSNYLKHNDETATLIHDGVLTLLKATDIHTTILNR